MSAPDTRTPAEPKPASTVVLVRERSRDTRAESGDLGSNEDFEVFLVQRHARMGFMGGLHVFPGGKVSAHDVDARVLARITDPEAVRTVWGMDLDHARTVAFAIAAVRETFEEAGVLLASNAESLNASALDAMRARLNAGEPWGLLLDEHALHLRLALLTPVARWITPESEPVRFDTCFYIAHAPREQRARHDAHETVAGAWMTPSAALAAARRGAIVLAPPTMHTLEELSIAQSIELAFARYTQREPPVVLPILRQIGDELLVLYPGDPAHPVSERALEGPTRHILKRR